MLKCWNSVLAFTIVIEYGYSVWSHTVFTYIEDMSLCFKNKLCFKNNKYPLELIIYLLCHSFCGTIREADKSGNF